MSTLLAADPSYDMLPSKAVVCLSPSFVMLASYVSGRAWLTLGIVSRWFFLVPELTVSITVFGCDMNVVFRLYLLLNCLDFGLAGLLEI